MKNKIVLIVFSFLCATQSVYAAEPLSAIGIICGVAGGVATGGMCLVAAVARYCKKADETLVQTLSQPGAPEELDQRRAPSLSDTPSDTPSGIPPAVLTMATTADHSIVVADDEGNKSVIEHSSSSSGRGVGGKITHAND